MNRNTLNKAKYLRINMTEAEQMLWEKLRGQHFHNFKFRRQAAIKIGKYNIIADFYCPKLKLIVEIDGSIHEKMKGYDEFREELITKKGLRVFRVTNDEVFRDVEKVLKNLEEYLALPLSMNAHGEGAGGVRCKTPKGEYSSPPNPPALPAGRQSPFSPSPSTADGEGDQGGEGGDL